MFRVTSLDLLLQLKHSLKLVTKIIEFSPHQIQSLEAPISAPLLAKLTELNASVLHFLSTNTCAAPLELMHIRVHPVKIHIWLLQLPGELADDPLAVVAEERDDLGDEVRRGGVLQHLQLLELVVQQTHGEHVVDEGVELAGQRGGRHDKQQRRAPHSDRESARRASERAREMDGMEAWGLGIGAMRRV